MSVGYTDPELFKRRREHIGTARKPKGPEPWV
jgi:hypothetical protein